MAEEQNPVYILFRVIVVKLPCIVLYYFVNRFEIQYHNPLKNYTSNEKAKWFFDNMTEYLDSLLIIQEEVAQRISEEVDIVLAQVVMKVTVV